MALASWPGLLSPLHKVNYLYNLSLRILLTGAHLMLCIIAYHGNVPVFLVHQLSEHLKVPPEKQSPALKALTSVTRTKLDAVWLRTMTHLRDLEKRHEPYATKMIELWKTLGMRARLSVLAFPLNGCCWNKCPLYKEKTEKRMARCVGCQKVQYCDKICQRGWVSRMLPPHKLTHFHRQ